MAKQSLFAAKQESTGLALPAGSSMSSVQTPEQESYSNYAIFMHRDKGKWSEYSQKIRDLADGDAVLVENGEPRKIAPFIFWLLDVHQYWCTLDHEFKPNRAWLVKESGQGVKEVLATMILVLHGGQLHPATCRFTGPMAKGVYSSKDCALGEAASPDWAKKSPDHAATLSIPQPNLRFKTELTWRMKKGRSGFPYYISSAYILPTSLGDAALFTAVDKEKLELMTRAFADHKQMIEKLVR